MATSSAFGSVSSRVNSRPRSGCTPSAVIRSCDTSRRYGPPRNLRSQIRGADRVGAHRFEGFVLLAKLDELGRRHPELIEHPLELARDEHQPPGIVDTEAAAARRR